MNKRLNERTTEGQTNEWTLAFLELLFGAKKHFMIVWNIISSGQVETLLS